MSSSPTSIDVGNELSRSCTIHTNISQNVIVTTEDKIKLVLISTKEILIAKREWWTPFGLVISFITTLCTSEFKSALGLSKEFWHAIFVILTITSSIWLIKAFYILFKNKGADDTDKIINQIKLHSTSQPTAPSHTTTPIP